jgi:hypothetical protein
MSIHGFEYTDATACTQCAVLLEENARLLEENRVLKDRLRAYQLRFDWEAKLFATPSDHLTDAEKIAARSLPDVVRQARKRETTDTARGDGLARVYMRDVAKRTGKSERRIGPILQKMAESGYIQRKVETVFDPHSQSPNTAVFIDTTPALLQAQFTAPDGQERNRGNGQKHFICKSCHSTNTQVRRLYEVICRDCGEVHHYDANRKEDRAFIVDGDTAANWNILYEDVPEPDAADNPPYPPPERPCIVCGAEDWRWDSITGAYYCHNHQPIEGRDAVA